MIRYLSRSEIDAQKWDFCIAQAQHPLIYALSWYLDCVTPQWAALVEEQQGRYQAVLPLPEARRMGIRYLKQPFLAQQLGFFSIESLSQTKRSDFLVEVKKHYPYIADYCFNTRDGQFDLPYGQEEAQYTHYLDLRPDYAILRKNYRPDRRQRLRQVERSHLSVIESTDPAPLIAMFRQTVAPQIPGGVQESFYELLRRLFHEVHRRQYGTLYYALRPDGSPGAGAWFVRWQGHIVYLFNAAFEAARPENGRTRILDQVIRQYAGTAHYLDFESAQVASIADFYASFGAKAYPFWRWHDNRLPFWIDLPKRLNARLRDFFPEKKRD